MVMQKRSVISKHGARGLVWVLRNKQGSMCGVGGDDHEMVLYSE